MTDRPDPPARADLDRLEHALPALVDPLLRAELEAARLRAFQFLADAKAPATLRAYAADWADFTAWCARYGLPALPATPVTVALYLGARADQWAWSTVAGRLSAITHHHEDAGYPSPTTHPLVRRVRAGARRARGTAGVGKKPLRWHHLAAMVAAIGADADRQPLARLRDAALLLLGFCLARRRAELVAIRVNDLTLHERGLQVFVARSKTDQAGRGTTVVAPYHPTDPAMCPVRATLAWCRAAGVEQYVGRRRTPAAAVPLFRGLTKHGTIRRGPLTDRHVATVIKDALLLARLDVDVDDFAGHSLRAGFVTEAAAAGVEDSVIMQQTGHTRLPTLAGYNRGDPFGTGAAAAVLRAAPRPPAP